MAFYGSGDLTYGWGAQRRSAPGEAE